MRHTLIKVVSAGVDQSGYADCVDATATHAAKATNQTRYGGKRMPPRENTAPPSAITIATSPSGRRYDVMTRR